MSPNESRLKLAIPKFTSLYRRGDHSDFYLISDSDFDPVVEKDHDVYSIDTTGHKGFEQSQIVWEVLRVPSNRSRKKMKLKSKLGDDDYIYRYSCRGTHARWQLNPGHYALRLFATGGVLLCETSFFIPWSEADKKSEAFERMLDHHKVPAEYRSFLTANQERLLEELAVQARQRFGCDRASSSVLESVIEVAVRQVSHQIRKPTNEDEIPRAAGCDVYLRKTLEAAMKTLEIQDHTLGLLEKVYDLLEQGNKIRENSGDDFELESLVRILMRGTDLQKFDEFGIMSVIVQNARNLQIEKYRRDSSRSVEMRNQEDLQKQAEGYSDEKEGLEYQLPGGTTSEFDQGFKKLSAKKKRQIIPHLVLSIRDETKASDERIDLRIDETWSIGRQSSEELKRFGAWNRPVVDCENRRLIIGGYFHNSISKNMISIVPTYKYSQFSVLGRTVSLLNPSRNYSISLGNLVRLEPGASYATPNPLHFYYCVNHEAIRLNDSQREQLRLTPHFENLSFTFRIDVFFEAMDQEPTRVLIAEHEWVGKDSTSLSGHSLQTMRPDR